MARYSSIVRDDLTQAPIEGVWVSVLDYAGVAATLTNDNEEELSNPFKTDQYGTVVFNTDVGRYTLEYRYGSRLVARDLNVTLGTFLGNVEPDAANAGKYVAFDAVGNPIASTGTGADAGLRTDLAASSGPTLVSYLGTSTAQAEFDRGRAQPQAQAMWAAIRADTRDIHILSISDSTADATGEWPYQTALQEIAPNALTHSVSYKLIDYANSVWNAPLPLIQTGAGGNGHTVYWDNYAISGKNLFSTEGFREAVIFGQGYSYDLIIISHGHNHGVFSTEAILTPAFKMVTANIMRLNPSASVFVTLQNPDTQYPSFTDQHVAAWRKVATKFGLGVIDAHHVDWDLTEVGGKPVDYQADGPHPTAAAEQAKWVPEVGRAIAERTPWTRPGSQPPGPMTVPRKSIAPNPSFADWPAGQAAPTGWVLHNCTVAKDPGRKLTGAKYSMKVTPTGINPTITCSVSSLVPGQRSRKLVIAAMVWVQTGMDSSGLAGRIDLTSGNGTVQVSGTSINRAAEYSRDGWIPQYAELELQSNGSSGTLTLYAGKADGTDTLPFWVQFFGVAEGDMPFMVDLSDHATATIEQFFAAGNVHIGAGVTGTLTTASAGFTLAGATVGDARTVIELPNLEIGHTYNIAGNLDSFTGGAGGAFYVTANANAGGGNVATSAPLAVGAVTLSFTATASAQSIIVWTNSSGTGYVFSSVSITDAYTGLAVPIALPLTAARNPNGTAVDATGGSGLFSLSSTPGTSIALLGEVAHSTGPLTDNAVWETELPKTYIATKNLTVTVNAKLTGAGTASTKTLKVYAYLLAADGTMGGDLGSAAQNMTGSAVDYLFTVTGTSLTPGCRIMFEARTVVTETAAADIRSQLNSVRVS